MKEICGLCGLTCIPCRNPLLWGTMKYLSEKIPKDTSSKVRINRDLYSYERYVFAQVEISMMLFLIFDGLLWVKKENGWGEIYIYIYIYIYCLILLD